MFMSVAGDILTTYKPKQLLFTTEDGVDIFEGDNLYSIDNMLNIRKHLLFNARYDDNTLLNNRIFFNSDYKHFSTKEKAEEYIAKNTKPLFKTDDGVDIFEGNTIYGINNDWKVFSHYTDLQNKVKSWGIKPVFSTTKKAEEYILMNKPVLSLSDVWDNLKVKDQKEVMKFVKSKLNKNG